MRFTSFVFIFVCALYCCCCCCCCFCLATLCTCFSRYFGAARDLPGVRELFEQARKLLYSQLSFGDLVVCEYLSPSLSPSLSLPLSPPPAPSLSLPPSLSHTQRQSWLARRGESWQSWWMLTTMATEMKTMALYYHWSKREREKVSIVGPPMFDEAWCRLSR